MLSGTSAYTALARPRAIHPMLVAVPVACFGGALVTDIAYASTTQIMWSDFSDWLLAAGMALGLVGLVVALVNIVADRRVRAARPVWVLVIGSLVVLAVAFLNNLVHSRDAWTSVVPQGLILSVATLVAALVTGFAAAAAARNQAAAMRLAEIR